MITLSYYISIRTFYWLCLEYNFNVLGWQSGSLIVTASRLWNKRGKV